MVDGDEGGRGQLQLVGAEQAVQPAVLGTHHELVDLLKHKTKQMWTAMSINVVGNVSFCQTKKTLHLLAHMLRL